MGFETDPGHRTGEPEPTERVLSGERCASSASTRAATVAPAGPGMERSMSYEIAERGPAAIAPAASLRQGPRPVSSDYCTIDDPDRELVRRWQSGESQAFEKLVRRHQTRVFRLLLRMLGDREEAEDVAQETFLSLHRHGHRFRGEARFSTFVYRVAANAALNRRRTLGRRRARIEGLAARQAAGDDLPSAPQSPEDATAKRELAVQVRAALQLLAPPLRMPLLLYDLEDLSYAEIARVLDLAEGTVKSRIHRARRALRDELGGLVGAPKQGAAS